MFIYTCLIIPEHSPIFTLGIQERKKNGRLDLFINIKIYRYKRLLRSKNLFIFSYLLTRNVYIDIRIERVSNKKIDILIISWF